MSKIQSKQISDVFILSSTGTQTVSGTIISANNNWSISTDGTIYATLFSGSFQGAVVSSSFTPWLLSGTKLYTSGSYSVEATGSLTIAGTGSDVFIIKHNTKAQDLLKVTSDGITKFYVNSSVPTGSADYGQIYFTSSSLYLGLD
jgi:hypothetical protein